MTDFQQHIAALFEKAGFQPVPRIAPYTFIVGTDSDVVYKRAIDGTLNEVVIVIRDNYAFFYTFRPCEDKVAKMVIYKSDAMQSFEYSCEKALEKARLAWKVGKNENVGCQRHTAQSGYNSVCGHYFTEDEKGGYVCAQKCWTIKKWSGMHPDAAFKKCAKKHAFYKRHK